MFLVINHITIWVCIHCCFSVDNPSPTLCDPMDCSTPGFPVHHHLSEFAQTHVHWVSDAIQSSYPLLPLLLLPSVFPSIRLLPSHGQSFGASASASVLPKNIQGWFPSGLTRLSSLLSKGLSRIFSSTTVWKGQFFKAQSSIWSNSCIHTWLLEKHSFDCMDLCWQSHVSDF